MTFSKTLLPEINRIWGVAGVRFFLRKYQQYIPQKNKCRWSHVPFGLSESLFDRRFLTDIEADLNIFVVEKATDYNHMPALGYTCNNDANNGGKYIVVGETVTTKEGQLVVFPLKRFSNTLAHEIGHALGLAHNAGRNFLMDPGYDMTGKNDPLPGEEERLSCEEIRTARSNIENGGIKWKGEFGPFYNGENSTFGFGGDIVDLT